MPSAPVVDFTALKARQRATWADGDFAVIGATLQIVSEQLCEAVELRAGARVLDVACGHGNTALAAARRFTRVDGVDYVEALLERARERARAERFDIDFRFGDAEELPFDDDSFDTTLSSFGVMFAPRAELAARELVRVAKPGGRIGLASWTRSGLIGQVFAVMSRFVPPPAGVATPFVWGEEAQLERLCAGAQLVKCERRSFVFRYRSPEHWIEVFRTWYGPTKRAFESLDDSARAQLEAALIDVLRSANVARDGALAAPSEYVEVVLEKR